MEAVTGFLRKYWGGLVNREGGAMSAVKNEVGHEAGKYMGERSRFLVQLEYSGSGAWSVLLPSEWDSGQVI